MEWSESQKTAIALIKEWLLLPTFKSCEFCLSGVAGTGKSTLMKYILYNICQDKKTALTAPTHKALRNLEKICKKKGSTLHSLHGLRPNTTLENFDLNNFKFTASPNDIAKMKDIEFLIIDECSMINSDLYKLNKERALKYNVKLLYVGDSKQLPPVSKNDNELEISKTFSVPYKFELTHIVRQEKGNPLLETFSLIRDDVTTKIGHKFMNYITQNRENFNGISGYKLYNEENFNKIVIRFFKDNEFEKNPNFIRGLAYTNKKIQERNTIVRNALFNNPKTILVSGDLLTSYTNLYDKIDSGVIPLLLNSDDYVVDTAIPHVCSLGFKVYAVTLMDTEKKKVNKSVLVVDHTDTSFSKFKDIANYLYEKAMHSRYEDSDSKKKHWFQWFKFQEKYLLMTNMELYNKHIYKRALDYGYFLTVHKAQGSTLQNVAVDMSDIYYPVSMKGNKYSNNPELANKLMYVALSRAKEKAVIKY